MLMDFRWHDYIAAILAGGAVVAFIVLLCWNGYDDYRRGHIVSSWRKSHD